MRVILWLIIILAAGIIFAIFAIETYEPGVSRIVGEWRYVGSGAFAGYIYETTGGSGTHPVLMFFFAVYCCVVSGLIISTSVVLSKGKTSRATSLLGKIGSFLIWYFIYSILGQLTLGLLPLYLLHKNDMGNENSVVSE